MEWRSQDDHGLFGPACKIHWKYRTDFQGRSNLGLSAEGRAQLPQLAERFRNIPLEAVYSSPLQRAVQTAEAVSHYHHLPIQTEEDLSEIYAGEWELKRFSDLPILYPEHWRLWCEEEAHFARLAVKALYRFTTALAVQSTASLLKMMEKPSLLFPTAALCVAICAMRLGCLLSGSKRSSFSEHSGKPGDL